MRSLGVQEGPQMGIIIAFRKKGSQQQTKTPVMIARVLAAFFSRLISIFSRLLLLACTTIFWCSTFEVLFLLFLLSVLLLLYVVVLDSMAAVVLVVVGSLL